MPAATDLSGFTVGATADRRSTEQLVMLERLGLSALHGPTIRTLPLDGSDGRLRHITEALVVDPPDVLVANTGLGVRSWFAAAASWGLDDDLGAALGSGRVIARGPKAASAAEMAGLRVWWRPDEARLRTVGDALVEGGLVGPLAGRTVAIQLHGAADGDLGPRLRAAGATVVEVPVYRWTLPDDRGPALRLVDRCLHGGVDAVTFTAGPAVTNLVRIAADAGAGAELVAALSGPVVAACIGPVCAEAAAAVGIPAPVVPGTWRLGSLVRAAADGLRCRRRALLAGEHTLTLQGAVVVVDGEVVALTDRERSVLAVLAARPGVVASRPALLEAVWGDPSTEPHALEAVVARLRAKLGPAGAHVETVVRRGYRLDATGDVDAATPGAPGGGTGRTAGRPAL